MAKSRVVKERYYVRKNGNEFHVYKRVNPNLSDTGENKVFVCRFNTREEATQLMLRLNNHPRLKWHHLGHTP